METKQPASNISGAGEGLKHSSNGSCGGFHLLKLQHINEQPAGKQPQRLLEFSSRFFTCCTFAFKIEFLVIHLAEKTQIWLRGTQQKVGRLSAGSKITSLLSANDMILCGTEKGVIKVYFSC